MQAGNSIALVFLLYFFLVAALKTGLEVVFGRAANFDQLDPVERNLQRVSHSIAYLAAVLTVLGGYSAVLTGIYTGIFAGIFTRIYIYIFASSPDISLWQAGIVAVILGVCVIRIRMGLRAFRFFNPQFHEYTPALRAGAAVKTVLGIGGLVYLHLRHDQYIHAGGWWPWVYDVLWILAAWNVVIGPVRLFLLHANQTGGAIETVQTDIEDNTFHW